MILAKIDSNSITTIREKGVESIIDWFEQSKQTFYALGWSYLNNQQPMEELFLFHGERQRSDGMKMKKGT